MKFTGNLIQVTASNIYLRYLLHNLLERKKKRFHRHIYTQVCQRPKKKYFTVTNYTQFFQRLQKDFTVTFYTQFKISKLHVSVLQKIKNITKNHEYFHRKIIRSLKKKNVA